MKKYDLNEFLLLVEVEKLKRMVEPLNENSRYSIEVSYRSDLKEVLDHYVRLVLGFVMSSMKQHGYHVKHVYTQKPYRILISTRNFDDGEWVAIISYSENSNCFIFTPGVYSKARGTASFKPDSSKKCTGTSAAEISREIMNDMHSLKTKPISGGERLNPIKRKRGPQS